MVYIRIPEERKRQQEREWARDPGHKKAESLPEGNPRPITVGDRNEKGRAAEKRFLRIHEEAKARGHFPPWLSSVVRASQKEDHLGIDSVAHTLEGLRIPLQIKSSEMGKDKFRQQAHRKHIPCIVVASHLSDEQIVARTIAEIAFIRDAMLRARAARG